MDEHYGLTFPIPRLIRFVSSALMPAPDVVAVLDYNTNTLQVSRERYDALDEENRERVLRTSSRFLSIADIN